MQDIRPAGFRQGYESHPATRPTDRQGLEGRLRVRCGGDGHVPRPSACPPIAGISLHSHEPPQWANKRHAKRHDESPDLLLLNALSHTIYAVLVKYQVSRTDLIFRIEC
jgi:hypothetical protein